MNAYEMVQLALEQGRGILRLAPSWVPRAICVPGRRLRLHPDDYYALGGERGAVDERWLASTTRAENGPLTGQFEGLSFIIHEEGGRLERVLLRDAVDEARAQVIGERLYRAYGCWPVYAKLFDNNGMIPFHIHARDEHASELGCWGKPEACYYPPQMNGCEGRFPYTFLGLEPGTSKEQVRERLVNFARGDNAVTDLSRAYRLRPGTGWDIPSGVLHAPGSLCTYELQKASDVFAIYQSIVDGRVVSDDLLWNGTPPERVGDYDYLIELIDWELNTDPDFARRRFMPPRPVDPIEQMEAEGYVEKWICYKSGAFSAKELTVLPGRTVTIRDNAAYGAIIMQGHGRMGVWDVATPTLIRFGQLTDDEFFVTEPAAREGVRIANHSRTAPLVTLKHFGPDNPDNTQ